MNLTARCVVCVGIPFPNTKNELVIQKRHFNDEYRKTTKQYKNILSGGEWSHQQILKIMECDGLMIILFFRYTTQAYRALNQALGR